jgi:hypothetical protein
MMKLVTHNVGGNLHAAAEFINDFDLARYVFHMDCSASGLHTVIVLRTQDDFDLTKWLDGRAARARARRLAREKLNAM